MSDLIRFGVSLEKKLLKQFDDLIHRKYYSNRSEAIRDLIRRELAEKKWEQGGDSAGGILLVYDHHKRELLHKITDIQHHFQQLIISSQHVHLDHDNCLEIIAVKGSKSDITTLSSRLKSIIGVKFCTLSITGTGN